MNETDSSHTKQSLKNQRLTHNPLLIIREHTRKENGGYKLTGNHGWLSCYRSCNYKVELLLPNVYLQGSNALLAQQIIHIISTLYKE